MKEHFIKLFNYDRHTNLQILDSIFAANQPETPVKLMAHLLSAQQIWLLRCKLQPAQGIPLWPDWQTAQFKNLIKENHAN